MLETARARWPPRPSPEGFRRLAVASAVALALIVVTGAAVRLTNSGLGCPTWPRCTYRSYVAPASYHALVEFVNRVITLAVLCLVAVTAVAAALRRPHRRDLLLLSGGLVVGVVAQAVLGGLTVLYKLAPGWVMAHFLLSMVVVWDAVVLVHRAAPDWRPGRRLPVRPEVVGLLRLLAVTAGAVLVLGTVVTGSGPHSGDAQHHQRFPFPLERVTQLHADLALFLTGLVVATLVALRVADAPSVLRRRARCTVGLLGLQIVIGYTQYFLDLPAGLVLVHVTVATALWLSVLWLNLGVTTGAGPAAVPAEPATPAALFDQPAPVVPRALR